jgi:hypothetical protein
MAVRPDFPMNLTAILPLLNQLDFGVYITDLDFRIVLWNRRAEEITGFKASAVVDKCSCDQVLNHVDRTGRPLCSTPLCPMTRAIAGNGPSGKPASLFARRHDARRLPVLANVSPLFDDHGATIGCIQMFRDESEALYDLRLARNVQRRILPQELPKNERIEFDVAFLPHDLVGGDFYDILRIGPNRFGVIVADVTGHGVSAALHTMVLKLLERTIEPCAESPARYLGTLNTEIRRIALPGGFATAVYGVIDAESGEFVYSSAGHCPPLHFHAGSRTVTKLEHGLGLPLGMFDTGAHGEYGQSRVTLEEGDLLLLYTDGIIEVDDENGEMFGTNGLSKLLGQELATDHGLGSNTSTNMYWMLRAKPSFPMTSC